VLAALPVGSGGLAPCLAGLLDLPGRTNELLVSLRKNLLFAGCERWNPNLFKKDKFSALWSCKFDLVSQMRGCSSVKFECAFMGLYLVSLNLVTVEKIDLSGLV